MPYGSGFRPHGWVRMTGRGGEAPNVRGRRAIVGALLVVAASVISLVLWRLAEGPRDDETVAVSTVTASEATDTGTSGPAFVAGVSDDGRYLVDQAGAPLLVQGDSPWSALARANVDEWRDYCENRSSNGFNMVILDLVVLPDGGRGNADGATDDGLTPFEDFSDWTTPTSEYWARVDAFVEIARSNNITVLLVPAYASDGSGAVSVLSEQSPASWFEYGAFLGNRYRDAPNVAWMMGGDFPQDVWSDLSPVYEAVREGVRSAGDRHLWTAHLAPSLSTDTADPGFRGTTSTDNAKLAELVDFQFVYTYQPPYAAVREAYGENSGPVLFGEGAYVGENNNGGPDTTPETIRRQSGWALTSGGVGDFLGTQDWWFPDGWSEHLDVPELAQRGVMHRVVGALDWWRLRPVDGEKFFTAGMSDDVVTGTSDDGGADVLESDLATAALADDGSLALVYLPTARSIEVDMSLLAEDVQGRWVSAATGVGRAAELSDLTPPGEGDWFLVLQSA